MEKSCEDCKNVVHKETKKSKIPYGYCKELNLDMVALQFNCSYYIKQDINNGVA
jgi:hypothetical protein